MFQLHVISDRQKLGERLEQVLLEAIAGGADVIQLRERNLPAGVTYELAQRLLPAVREKDKWLFVNDRVDVALAAYLDGVHLAGRSLPPKAVRPILPKGVRLGLSVHSLEEARAAERDGADYITYGHIFPSGSKPGLQHRGTDALQKVVESVNIPVLAIGGINPSNLEQVLATGCAGVAVISSVLEAADPRRAAAQLKEGIHAAFASGFRPRCAMR